MNPHPSTLNPQPSTLNPQPSTLNPQPSTLNPQPSNLDPEPLNINPLPSTLNPQPSTLNPQPSTLNRSDVESREVIAEFLPQVVPSDACNASKNRMLSCFSRFGRFTKIGHVSVSSQESGTRLAKSQGLRHISTLQV